MKKNLHLYKNEKPKRPRRIDDEEANVDKAKENRNMRLILFSRVYDPLCRSDGPSVH